MKVGFYLGHLICVGRITKEGCRLVFTRLCMVFKASSNFPKIVKMKSEDGDTIFLQIKYEWKPLSCADCKVFGHSVDTYRKNVAPGKAEKRKKVWVTKKQGLEVPNSSVRVLQVQERQMSSNNQVSINTPIKDLACPITILDRSIFTPGGIDVPSVENFKLEELQLI